MNRNLKMASTRDVDHIRFAIWPSTIRLHIVEATGRCRPRQNWRGWLSEWAAAIAMAVIALTLAISAHASSGDAAFVAGTYTITPSADGSTAIVNVAGIQNTTTTTTTGSLGFALWYSTTPYNGGTLNGFQVAASYLPIGQCTSSQLEPGGECVSIAVQATLTPPPAGTYYPVLLLIEHTASCPSSNGYCTDDFVKLLQTSDGSPTVTVGSTTGGSSTGTTTSSVSIVGSFSYTADIAAGTAQLDVAEILNSSQTYTTGTLRLELWLTLGTYAGGPINGYRIATYQLTGSSNGQLGPNQYFSSISETVPLTNVPGAGTYNVTLVVTEYSSSCTATDHYCIDTYGAFPTNLTIAGGGNAGGNSNISIVGNYSYSTDSSLSTAQLTVAEILNSSPTYKTGTLRLELWLTTSAYAGGSITGNRIAMYQLNGTTNGSLGPNQEFNNISASVPLTNLPSAGSYYATLIVSEYTKNCGTSDGYCIDTYGNFSNPFIISAPSTTVPTVAAASGGSGGGGGGSIDGFECLVLASLAISTRLIRCARNSQR
jgi:hypothetical protein